MKKILVGFVAGILVTAGGMWLTMPKMMIHEHKSPLGYDETVAKIKSNIEGTKWEISSMGILDKKLKKKYDKTIPATTLINFCHPDYATAVLNDADAQKISIMMPCTIAVYKKPDGKTYVSTMNMKMMGKMFGGKIAEVMGGAVADEEEEFTNFL